MLTLAVCMHFKTKAFLPLGVATVAVSLAVPCPALSTNTFNDEVCITAANCTVGQHNITVCKQACLGHRVKRTLA
jgi:hypothetical protein